MNLKPSHKAFFLCFWGLLVIGGILLGYTFLSRRMVLERVEGSTMGTYFRVSWVSISTTPSKKIVASQIQKDLHRVNVLMSTYLADSEISKFNAFSRQQSFPLSGETFWVVDEAIQIAKLTQGAFDITVAPLVNLWGFGPQGQRQKVPSQDDIHKKLLLTGYQKLSLSREKGLSIRKQIPSLEIDLSGIAKGYGVDRVGESLERMGIHHYLVDIGGELRARGKKQKRPWTVAIEIPRVGTREVQKIIYLENLSLATSGDYRNYFEQGGKRYSHALDPRKGYPISHRLASVSVLHEKCMRADALATALMVLGPEEGFQLAMKNKWAVLFLVKVSEGFQEKPTPEFARVREKK